MPRCKPLLYTSVPFTAACRTRVVPMLRIFCLLLLISGSGCTVVGHAIGSYADRKNTRTFDLPLDSALCMLSEGDSVSVILRSEDSLRGEYAGMEILSFDNESVLHAVRPAAAAENRTDVYPGDTLILERHSRPAQQITYVHAEPNRLVYFDSTQGTVRYLLFEHVARLSRRDGRPITKPYHEQLRDGTFAQKRAFRLRVGADVRRIDTTAMQSVRFTYTPGSGRLVGALFGLVFDAVQIHSLLNWKMNIYF